MEINLTGKLGLLPDSIVVKGTWEAQKCRGYVDDFQNFTFQEKVRLQPQVAENTYVILFRTRSV